MIQDSSRPELETKARLKIQARKGFTLLELAMVISAVLILIAAIYVVINPPRRFAEARNVERRAEVNTIQNAIDLYIQDGGTYPLPNVYPSPQCLGTDTVGGKTILADGGILIQSSDVNEPAVTRDSSGNFFAVWRTAPDLSGYNNVYLQKYSPQGVQMWQQNQKVNSSINRLLVNPNMMTDNSGNVIVVWLDKNPTNGLSTYVKVKKISGAGTPLWGDVTANTISSAPQGANIGVDNNNNVAVTWSGIVSAVRSIYVRKLSGSDGISSWPGNEKEVDSFSPSIASNNTQIAVVNDGNYLVAWEESSTRTSLYDIYFQKINSLDGSRVWSIIGDKIANTSPLNTQQQSPTMAADTNGNAIVSWVDGSSRVYAQKFNVTSLDPNISTTAFWTGGDKYISGGWKVSLAVDANGYTIFSWQQGIDVYAKKIDSSGNDAWPPPFVTIQLTTPCTVSCATNDVPRVSIDGVGNAYVIWLKATATNNSLLAQKLSGPCFDLTPYLVPKYLPSIPSDPKSTYGSTYTGYFINRDAQVSASLTVSAPMAELGENIEAKR